MQLEQTLSIDSFNIYLSLIEILYGKNNLKYKNDYIAKNYIYLFNKDTSIIKTNVSPFNQINITNGFCIIMWFYFYDYCNENEKSKGILCQIMSKDLQIIDIILSNDYDIDIKYNSRENLLKESKGHKFKLKSNVWTQIKIQFTDNKIRLFLYQNNDNNNDNNLENTYELKEYLINCENKNNDNYFINKIDNLKCNNFKISYLNFFLGYEGLVGTILFCNNSNINSNENMVLNSISGLQNNKVKDFIKKVNLKNIYFIIAPSLYCEEENKFMETTNDITAELSFEEKEYNLNLNSVLKINNYTKNIFYLGGCNNLLPLFEILYKFCYELDNKKENNIIEGGVVVNNILKTLFQLLEIIFINKKKNCIEAYKNSYHFFESLQLFLENIDDKYFNLGINTKKKVGIGKEYENKNYLLSSLLNLGKYFFEIKNKKILDISEHHGFFANILFYPSILMKFNSVQQNFIFSFFDIIKKDNKFFNDYKSYFISFDKICKLLILLSEKNKDEYIPSNLFNIIKNIFEDFNTTDGDRESLFLLYNSHLICDKIFINIMEIFIIYFDINTNIKLIDKFLITKKIKTNNKKYEEKKIDMRNNSIKYFLYSSNFFIENLLKILLSNNSYIKKSLINFLRVLTNKYNSIFEEYFSFVDECNKSYKNKRINKKDFFYFIKENVILNCNNQKIINDIEKNKNNNGKKKKRKSSFENKVNKNKINDLENTNDINNIIHRRKSLDIQFGKIQKKKFILFLTKKHKKKKINNNIKIKNYQKFTKKRSISYKKKKNSNTHHNTLNNEKDCKGNKELNLMSSNLVSKLRSKSSSILNVDFNKEESEMSLINININKISNKNIFGINSIKEKNNKNITMKKSSKKLNNESNKRKRNKNRKKSSKKQIIINNSLINEIKENEINKDFNEDSNINCDISMILYDWLVSIKSDAKDSNFYNKSETLELIHQILNFIVKFLSKTTDLAVIYKTFFVILGQKSLDNNPKDKNEYNIHYSRLLSYFSNSSTFRQLLEEIIIDSFLGYNNDKKVINKYNYNQNFSKIRDNYNKKEIFEKIYIISKELLIDIYLYRNNHTRNYIIYEIYNIILKKYNGLQKKYNDAIFKLFNFIKIFYSEIINKYHELLKNNYNDNQYNNINNENSNNTNNIENANLKIYSNYIHLFTLFFEFSFVLKNYNKFISKKNYNELNNSFTFPNFLKEGMIFELNSNINNLEKWNIFQEYKSIIRDIREIYTLNNIFKELKIPTTEIDKKEEVFHLDIEIIQKLVNEIIFKKDLRGKFKENIELLFLHYNKGGYFNNFPLINILTLYKCVILNYDDKNSFDNGDLIHILNDIQNYIIFIILISCNIKKDESFKNENLNYDEIQEIIYQNLLFIIRNIIYKFTKNIQNKEDTDAKVDNKANNKKDINKDIDTNEIINDENEENNSDSDNIDENEEEYESHFITVLNNIISLLANIYITDKESINVSNSFLGWKKGKKIIDINSTGVNKLIEYYIKKFNSFFNFDNLHYFSNHNNDESNFLIIQQKKNLYINLVKNINNQKFKDKSNSELYHYKIFKSICLGREQEIKKKLKLLLISNQEYNKISHKKANKHRYTNLLIKIHFLHLYNENNNKLIEESRNEIYKVKNYRKIKKYLYSFNNSFSNLEAFYSKDKDKKYILTYKISNYLSGDNTRKLIVPVLDLDNYMPNFRKFKSIDGNLFKKNILNKVYKINLKIIDKERKIINPKEENKNYYLYNDICLIKTTHHIRGKIFHKTEKELAKKIEHSYLYFTADKNISKEYLMENCPDYDSINGTCFGSTFKNNSHQKDDEVYLKINFSEINFIFLRKYCYRNNSLEIFLNNHKSYYFKFKLPNERDNFIGKLISLLNHFSLNKKLFRKIKSIDENNKSIVLGYYKDIDNNKDYKSISTIKDLWKNNKISTLEYIMWINIYGNRSFRDIAQYPVFPWILNDYNLNKVENIINLNTIRNFDLPMGMMSLDEKSNSRKEGYIEGYKLMVNEISEDINVKKPNDIIEDDEDETKNSTLLKTSSDELKDSDEDNTSNKIRKSNNIKENKLKIPDYRYDLDKLYSNLNIEYERIPYFFGTHYSNPMYVSHYLLRLFPFSFNIIEIQGDSFDCPERLFFNLKSTFYSCTHEKCDLRELIPEFFTLPEIFVNINNLNFGQTEDRYYISNMRKELNNKEEEKEKNINIINTNDNNISTNDKYQQINDVVLPPWTKQNPYYFIQIMREIFEGGNELNKREKKYLNINPWIDLIFGCYQRGIKAQKKGNLFLPASYDGVINSRIKEENILKNREDNEFLIRFFEIGITPTKVFEKKCKDQKKEINNQITSSINYNETNVLNKEYCITLKNKNNYIYIGCNYLENNKLLLIDDYFIGQNVIIQKNNEITNMNNENNIGNSNYLIRESQIIKDFPLVEIKGKNIGYKLIIKSIFKESLFIISGYYDGSIYLINTNIYKKVNKRNICNISSELNNNENNILQTFGNKLITSLEISKDEKYMICGNQKGVIIIFTINYSLFIENKKYIELLKVIKSHNNYKINSISINNNLFLFASCSYDGYINLYTFPKIRLINSLYINDLKMKKNEIDYVFLSSQPLPTIVLYSNKKCIFKVYSINGHELNCDYNDLTLLKEIEIPLYNNDSMISPIIFTDNNFNDYLAYIFKYKYVLIRKFPDMKCILKINCSNNNYDLSKLVLSNDLNYLYVYEKNKNNIYIIDNSIYSKDNIIDNNSLKTTNK